MLSFRHVASLRPSRMTRVLRKNGYANASYNTPWEMKRLRSDINRANRLFLGYGSGLRILYYYILIIYYINVRVVPHMRWCTCAQSSGFPFRFRFPISEYGRISYDTFHVTLYAYLLSKQLQTCIVVYIYDIRAYFKPKPVLLIILY